MKILVIGAHPNTKGGIATIVKNHMNLDSTKLYEKEFLFSYNNENIILQISTLTKILIEFIKKINKFDLIHVHMSTGFSFVREGIFILLAKLFKKKSIIHFHSGGFVFQYNSFNKIFKMYIRLIFNCCDTVICLNEQQQEIINKISKSKVIRLNNSVSIPHNVEYKDKSNEVIFIGKVCKEKGIYDLIDALKLIEDDDIILSILGDGEIDKLKEYINKNNIENRCEVLGWIDKCTLENKLRNAGMMVLPSYHEGMPFSILEAMSFGLPIVSTRVGSIGELIVNGENGFIVEPGQVRILKERIKELLINTELRRRISQNNIKLIKNKYSIEQNFFEVYKLYCNLIKE